MNDALSDKVRKAVSDCDREHWATIDGKPTPWSIIRAELLRLTRENDEWQTRCLQFQTERDHARQMHADRDEDVQHEWARAERAEAELAEARKNETVALGLWNAAEGRATKAEAELAAFKARIADAPEYRCEADIISGRDGDYISAVLIHDDNAFQYPDVDGKRVRLLVEE